MPAQSDLNRLVKALRKFDVAINPAVEALFLIHSSGFTIWALPDNKPPDWPPAAMTTSWGRKPTAYIGNVLWEIAGDKFVSLSLETDAEDLRAVRLRAVRTFNRREDVRWAKQKIVWLFNQANVAVPKIVITKIPGGDL